MKSNMTVGFITAGALLVGSAATAALMNHHKNELSSQVESAHTSDANSGQGLEFAQILNVNPITEKKSEYGTITGVTPIEQTTSNSVARHVCHDVVVRRSLPQRDTANVGGTLAGAVLGGLAGSRFGGGHGRNAATVAGTLAGGFIGNHIERVHKENQTIDETERLCHTEQVPVHSSVIKGYTVNYRKDDGSVGSLQMDAKPADNRVDLGQTDQTVGYAVTYLYRGQQMFARLPSRPMMDKLPVVNGQIVTQTAAPISAQAPTTAPTIIQ